VPDFDVARASSLGLTIVVETSSNNPENTFSDVISN